MKSISKFSIHQTALTFACVMAISSLIFLLPMSLVFLNAPMVDASGNPVSAGMPFGFMLLMPFLYLILGYIMTAIGTGIYNWIAKYTGGIQFELTEKNEG